ncbi:hypothetical protein INT48_007386 [Thamnidium elegans]|uniref:Uncharacterized protein n=1 Tax=Thamnidium elegans TaxID=101142 RepID=A0A8H7VRU0_9FUNG|nr:hypothetical protein INT48_007386 [Thamnidium elegans]
MKSLLFILLAVFISTSFANTEKLIFEASSSYARFPCNGNLNVPSLTPPYTKIKRSLIPSSKNSRGSPYLYNLSGLNDRSSYEVRISYPAITPADFYVQIISACQSSDGTLLYILEVFAKYTGVSHIQGMESRPVIFDLVLEKLYLGVLFYQVYKIVIAIVTVIGLGQFLLIPYVRRLITNKEIDSKI